MGANVMQEFTDSIMKSLAESEKEGNLKWVKPWREIDTHFRNAFTNHNYKGLHNILTCLLEGRADPRYASFNQIRQAKGKLKTGSKATRLIAWNFTEKDDPKTGKKKKLVFSKAVCVFSVEDTEGLELKPLEIPNTDVKPQEDVMKLFEKLGIKVIHKDSNSAHYNPTEDHIVLPRATQFESQDAWACTALHEAIHWTAKRVDRDCSQYHFDSDSRSMEELVAELGCMFLAMRLKINGYMDKNNLAYIKSWMKASTGKNGERFIYKACSLAEKACKFILGEVNTKTEEEPEEAAA